MININKKVITTATILLTTITLSTFAGTTAQARNSYGYIADRYHGGDDYHQRHCYDQCELGIYNNDKLVRPNTELNPRPIPRYGQ